MKARKYILGVALIGLIGSGCTNTWDEHYAQDTSKVNNTEISVVNATITDYLAQEPSLSDMYQLFNETGMVEQLLEKEQMYTILAVESGIAAGMILYILLKPIFLMHPSLLLIWKTDSVF